MEKMFLITKIVIVTNKTFKDFSRKSKTHAHAPLSRQWRTLYFSNQTVNIFRKQNQNFEFKW